MGSYRGLPRRGAWFHVRGSPQSLGSRLLDGADFAWPHRRDPDGSTMWVLDGISGEVVPRPLRSTSHPAPWPSVGPGQAFCQRREPDPCGKRPFAVLRPCLYGPMETRTLCHPWTSSRAECHCSPHCTKHLETSGISPHCSPPKEQPWEAFPRILRGQKSETYGSSMCPLPRATLNIGRSYADKTEIAASPPNGQDDRRSLRDLWIEGVSRAIQQDASSHFSLVVVQLCRPPSTWPDPGGTPNRSSSPQFHRARHHRSGLCMLINQSPQGKPLRS